MKTHRGVVCGVGYLGRFHAQKITAHPNCELAGVFDANPEQAKKVATELNTKVFLSLDELVKASPDFAIVAAATQAHYEIANVLIQNKIPTLIEKPIAATAQMGVTLAELSEKLSVPVTVGHLERFNPSFQILRDYAAKNPDDIRFLELNRCAPFRVRGSDVSVLHDLTVHDLDLVDELFDLFNPLSKTRLKSYTMFGSSLIRPTVDEVSLRLVLENGTQISIQNSRTTPKIVRNFRAILSDKTVRLDTATQEGDVLIPDSSQPDLCRIEPYKIDKVDTLALQLATFITRLETKTPFKVSPRAAAKQLEWIESIITKHQQDQKAPA